MIDLIGKQRQESHDWCADDGRAPSAIPPRPDVHASATECDCGAILKERDIPDGANIGLISHVARYALDLLVLVDLAGPEIGESEAPRTANRCRGCRAPEPCECAEVDQDGRGWIAKKRQPWTRHAGRGSFGWMS